MRLARGLPPIPAPPDLTERVAAIVCECSYIGADGLRGACDCTKGTHGRARCDSVLQAAREIIKLVREES
jgi:hypothetical protein